MKIKLEQINETIKDAIDVFICSASFEDRCLSIPKEIAKFRIPHHIISKVEDLDVDVKIVDNADILERYLEPNAAIIAQKLNDPAQSFNNLDQALKEVFSEEKAQCYLLDASTFTHESLLMLFKLLQLRLKKNDKLIVAYTGAKEYSYNEPSPDKKWLSKGIRNVRSILGYPGLLDPSKKNHLMVLFGFESERTKKLIDIYDYDLVSLAFGGKKASISDAHQKLNQARYEDLLKLYPNANSFEISLVDSNDTKDQLLKYIGQFSDYNSVIAPMNNKVSSIGAGLAAMINPEIQLCYVTANQYNIEGYSLPSDDCYLFEVKLP